MPWNQRSQPNGQRHTSALLAIRDAKAPPNRVTWMLSTRSKASSKPQRIASHRPVLRAL